MRRYHLKFNSIKCSTGSTFYSIYLANCVCIRAVSDVKNSDTVAGCLVFFSRRHRCCCCRCYCCSSSVCWFGFVFFVASQHSVHHSQHLLRLSLFARARPRSLYGNVASNADCERQHIELCSMDGYFCVCFFFSCSLIALLLFNIGFGLVVSAAGCLAARYEPVVSIALISMHGNQLRTRALAIQPRETTFDLWAWALVRTLKNVNENAQTKREVHSRARLYERILFANLSNLQEFAFSCFYFTVQFVRPSRRFPLHSHAYVLCARLQMWWYCRPLFAYISFALCSILMIAPKMVNLNYLLYRL